VLDAPVCPERRASPVLTSRVGVGVLALLPALALGCHDDAPSYTALYLVIDTDRYVRERAASYHFDTARDELVVMARDVADFPFFVTVEPADLQATTSGELRVTALDAEGAVIVRRQAILTLAQTQQRRAVVHLTEYCSDHYAECESMNLSCDSCACTSRDLDAASIADPDLGSPLAGVGPPAECTSGFDAGSDQLDAGSNPLDTATGVRDAALCTASPDASLLFAADDTDGDGIGNRDDNCIRTPNSEQADGDGDQVGDACDNCAQVANRDQADRDEDGSGDTCEGWLTLWSDEDRDGIPLRTDNCRGQPNPRQEDADRDGWGDACDNCVDAANLSQTDDDGNSIGDACQEPPGVPKGDCPGTPEHCNGVDDDCDDMIDEGCDPVVNCEPQPEVCDGKDNDCDGEFDDGCSPKVCKPFVEVCNGVDDDCDRATDELCVSCDQPSLARGEPEGWSRLTAFGGAHIRATGTSVTDADVKATLTAHVRESHL